MKRFVTEPPDDLILWLWLETHLIDNYPEDENAVCELQPESRCASGK